MPKVNPKILVWARETAGLAIEEAVKKLKIKDAYGNSAQERLALFENGTNEPTRSLLVKMAKYYRRPLLTFYLSSPPKKGNRGQDFRSLPKNYSPADDSLIDALLRDIRARQSIIKAALQDDDEITQLDFIGSYKLTDGIDSVINALHDVIKLDIIEFRSQSNSSDAFNLLRNKVQEAGIYVLLIGNLGSHHTSIDVDNFRGFALADELAPFIVINDQDSHGAWSFTLIHEVVHLLFGETVISGGASKVEIERFCDQVAGEFLLPSSEIHNFNIKINTSKEDIAKVISEFAKVRNISSSMVAYKLYKSRKINFETWDYLNNFYRNLWFENRTERRKIAQESGGGPSYYTIRQHRLGIPLIKLVQGMMASGSLSTSKSGKVLGVKAKKVQILFDTIRQDKFVFGDR